MRLPLCYNLFALQQIIDLPLRFCLFAACGYVSACPRLTCVCTNVWHKLVCRMCNLIVALLWQTIFAVFFLFKIFQLFTRFERNFSNFIEINAFYNEFKHKAR